MQKNEAMAKAMIWENLENTTLRVSSEYIYFLHDDIYMKYP